MDVPESPEAVALALWERILKERPAAEAGRCTGCTLLDLYARCLATVRGERGERGEGGATRH